MSNLLAELEEQRRRLTGRSQTSTGSAALSGAQKTGTSEKSGSDGVIELLERQRQSIPANTTVFVRGSESGGQVLGTTAPRTADSTVSAPKKQTRPLEEIRADIDKAQADLSVITKTTVPLFEAGWHKERRQAAQDRVDALKSEWKDAAGWDYDPDTYARAYYNTRVTEEQGKLAANGRAAQAFEDIYRLDDAKNAIMGVLAIAQRGGAPVSEWQEAADTIADVLGLTVESAGGFDRYAETLRSMMHSGELDTRRSADEKTVADSGLDLELLKEARERQNKAEQAQARREVIEQETKRDPFGMNAVSVLMAPLQGAEYVSQLLGNIGHNDTNQLESYRPLDVNDMPLTDSIAQIRGTTAEDIDNKVLSWLYQNGMSIADSSAQIAAFGPASVFVMGGSAAANQMKDVLERGGTNRQAMISGAASGAAEMLFEKFSIDKLLAQKSVTGWKSWLAETAKQMGVEASEESFTEIANILSDAAIMGENSDFARNVSNYTAQGYAPGEAKKRAFLDSVGQVALAAAGGAFSGGVMGGAVNAMNGISNSQNPFIQAYEMGLTRQEAAKAPQNAQEAQGSQGVQTVNPVGENAVSPRVGDVAAAESQTEGAERGNPVIDAYNWAVQGNTNGAVSAPMEGQKNTTPEGGENIRLTDADVSEYMNTGKRLSVRNAKQEMLNSGNSPVLTTIKQVKEFIVDAIKGKRLGETKAYGKVGRRLADAVNAKAPSISIDGYYMELVTDELKHAYDNHSSPKQKGDIALTDADFENLPDYIDTFDDVISVEKYNDKVKIRLSKQINGKDYIIVLETVSSGRKSVHPQDVIGISNEKFAEKYGGRIAGSQRAETEISEQPNTSPHTDYDPSTNPSISQSTPGVNTESGTFNPVIEAYDRAKGAQEGGSRSIPAAHVGSTGIDDAAIRGREAILSPGAEIVNRVVEDALDKAKGRRADVNEILSVLVRQGDDPAVAAQMAEAYRSLTESGAYAVDGAGKLYETGGENDLSLNERQGDSVRLGKRNINAFQFDHPEVHRYYAEAAERLLSDFDMTTRGERFFNYVPDQSNPVVTGVKRNTSAPIVTMLDDLNMTYERAQDVLTRIINDQGQENIADAKRVEMLLDDILKHGYESLSGPVEPNADYIETLRRMGQIAPDELTDTGSRRGGGQIRTDADGYAVVDDYDEEGGDIPSTDRNLSAAERGFADNAYNRWVEDAESFHPEGEKAARNPSLPTVNPDGLKTSKVGQTVMEAANTPEERVVDIQNRYVRGGLTVASRTNEGLVREAVTKLESDPEGTLKAWQDDVRKGKVSNDLAAMGAALLDSERVKSDGAAFMDVLTDYVELCSTAGQALQAQRIYKALTPEGRLYMVKKVAQGLAEETGVQLDFKADMVEDLLHAQSDEDMDAALDKIYDHLAAQIPSTFKDKWTALRYMNMLGNFKTQIRNLAGNSLMSGMKAVKNEVAAAIEAAVARVNPDMERTQSFRVGKAWMDAAKADFENVREAAQGNGRYDDSSRSAIEKEIQSRRRIFKTRPLETYRKATNWATNAGDDIFIKHHYARALAGYLKANGVRVEQFLEGNVDLQLLNRATDFAIREAQEATFHDNNAFSDWVASMGRGAFDETKKFAGVRKAGRILGEGLMPFRKTPANVLARAYEYSPVSFVGLGFDQAIKAAMKKPLASASEVIESMAKGLTGSGIMALGYVLAAKGWLRGTGDDDDEEVDALMNRQDYSLVIPGKGSYTIDWLR